MCQICSSLHAYVPDCAYDPAQDPLAGPQPGALQTSLIQPGADTPLDVALEAGMEYEIRLGDGQGDMLQGGVLVVHDASGAVVATAGADGTLRFTAGTDGGYVVSFLPADSAGASAGGSVEAITLEVLQLEGTNTLSSANIGDLAEYLARGFWEDQGATWHAWKQSSVTVNVTGLTAEGQQLARWALDVWSAFTGLEFRFVQQGGELTFGNSQSGAFTQTSYFPDTNAIVNSHVNISRAWLDNNGTTLDSYSFQTFLHEIGHALGLGHAGPYDGNARYGRDAIFAEDSWQMTLMSYFSQTQNTAVDADFAYAVTPMLADILAMEMLYGTLDPAQSGNSVYGVGGNIGGTLGMLWDQFIGHGAQHGDAFSGKAAITLTIHDISGYNTVDLSNDTRDQRVDLNGGGIWDVYGKTGTLILSEGAQIHAFHAGSGRNHITGNDLDNHIVGGMAADTILGGHGDDLIDALAGDDFIMVAGGNNTIWGGAGADTIHGGTGDDIIGGGNGNDLIYGTGGNNELWGGDGNDTIWGGTGNDTVGGGRGQDVIHGGGGVNELWGGRGNDTIYGGDNGDVIGGGPGNDEIRGGAGADTIYAGPGNDQLWGGGGADSFYFYRNYDWNQINDFSFWQGDRLLLAQGLWRESGQTLNARQVLEQYAEVNEWGNTVLDFGAGNTIICLQGISDLDRLADHIEII